MARPFFIATLVISLCCSSISLGHASSSTFFATETLTVDQPTDLPFIKRKRGGKRKKPKTFFKKSHIRPSGNTRHNKGMKRKGRKDRGTYVRKKGARWSGAFF